MEMLMENEDFLGNYLETDWIDKLYGSFISDKSAETIISELRSDRQFSREVTGF